MAMRCAIWVLALVMLGIVTSRGSTISANFTALAEADVATDNSTESSNDNDNSSTDVGDDAVAVVMVRHILHFSDVHLNISESLNVSDSAKIPVAYGDDAPISLLVSALDYAKKLLPDPDFFLYTGDHTVHGELSDKYLAEAVEENVETMAKYYSATDNGTTLDVTAILGNADTSASLLSLSDGVKLHGIGLTWGRGDNV